MTEQYSMTSMPESRQQFPLGPSLRSTWYLRKLRTMKDFDLLTPEEALWGVGKLRDEFALSGEFNQEDSSSNPAIIKDVKEDDENKFREGLCYTMKSLVQIQGAFVAEKSRPEPRTKALMSRCESCLWWESPASPITQTKIGPIIKGQGDERKFWRAIFLGQWASAPRILLDKHPRNLSTQGLTFSWDLTFVKAGERTKADGIENRPYH